MKIIFVCGYANAGKTHLLSRSKYLSVSTSKVLDNLAVTYLKNNLGCRESKEYLTERLISKMSIVTPTGQVIDPRQLKIDLAEKLIVPVLGRMSLISAAFEQIPVNSNVVLFESIGGEELNLAIQICVGKGWNYDCVNIRRREERKGVDIRELAGEGLTEYEYSYLYKNADGKDSKHFDRLIYDIVNRY